MNTFSREDTKLVKGFAIILMLYHHLFAFPNRIQDGSSYIPVLEFSGIARLCYSDFSAKYVWHYFCFWVDTALGCLTNQKKSTLIALM